MSTDTTIMVDELVVRSIAITFDQPMDGSGKHVNNKEGIVAIVSYDTFSGGTLIGSSSQRYTGSDFAEPKQDEIEALMLFIEGIAAS